MGNSAQGRLVAIDATVQRRPPGGLVSAEDAACNRLTELALNDVEVSLPCTTPGCCLHIAHLSVSGKGAILSGMTQRVVLSCERTLQIFNDVDHVCFHLEQPNVRFYCSASCISPIVQASHHPINSITSKRKSLLFIPEEARLVTNEHLHVECR